MKKASLVSGVLGLILSFKVSALTPVGLPKSNNASPSEIETSSNSVPMARADGAPTQNPIATTNTTPDNAPPTPELAEMPEQRFKLEEGALAGVRLGDKPIRGKGTASVRDVERAINLLLSPEERREVATYQTGNHVGVAIAEEEAPMGQASPAGTEEEEIYPGVPDEGWSVEIWKAPSGRYEAKIFAWSVLGRDAEIAQKATEIVSRELMAANQALNDSRGDVLVEMGDVNVAVTVNDAPPPKLCPGRSFGGGDQPAVSA